MASRTLSKGGVVITVDPGLGDLFPSGDVLVEDGELINASDVARGRRLVSVSRDDILRHAAGNGSACLGGDWIPQAYEAVEA